MNEFIIIQYRKSLVKTGKPIAVKVGRKELFTDKIIFENISGNIVYDPIHKGKHGTTTPMKIKIEDALDVEPYVETDIEMMDVSLEEDPKESKRIRERIRYQKNHPEARRQRKSIFAGQ